MLSDYNQQALATAYSSGWLTDDQYHAATAGLEAMPHLLAPAFLQEQGIISEGHAEGLRQALAEYAAAQASAVTVPLPAPAADGLAASSAPIVGEPPEPPGAPTEPLVHVLSASVGEERTSLPGGHTIDELLRLVLMPAHRMFIWAWAHRRSCGGTARCSRFIHMPRC